MRRYNLLIVAVAIVISLTMGINIAQSGEKEKTPVNIVRFLKIGEADRIVVTYAPKADFASREVRKLIITDAEIIKGWLKALGKIPARGPGMLIKMRGDAPEYRIEFFRNKAKLAALRVKGNKLDAPANESWDFYRNEDRTFVSMVKKAFKKDDTAK